MTGYFAHLRRVTPHPFFAGFLVGLVLLALAGRVISGWDYLNGFKRLHRFIDPDTLYYPTASQVTAIAQSHSSDGKIVVVVGGSSVMRGDGQGDKELWSDALQSDIGDRFSVVNLAMDGGEPTEYGGVAVQALLERGIPVIYVGDLGLGGVDDPTGLQFKYLYWDATYKGLLPDYPPRDAFIDVLARARQTQPAVTEAQMRGRVESWLYDTDLWNWIGYELVFTAPSKLIQLPAAWPTTPRRLFPDLESGIDAPTPESVRYPPTSDAVSMEILRSTIGLSCTQGPDGIWADDPAKAIQPGFQQTASTAFSEDVRARTIIPLESETPYYLSRLSSDELACYRAARHVAAANLEPLGYHPLVFGEDFTADDYADRLHLLASGGRKLAAAVAPQVLAVAAQLGYQ